MELPSRISSENNEPDVNGAVPQALFSRFGVLWLWVLPMAILAVLNLQGYFLISGNMDAAQLAHARYFGTFNVLNLLLGVLVFLMMGKLQRSAATDFLWAFIPIAAQVAWLWYAFSIANDLLPDSVTGWIYTPERFYYNQFSFSMIPLFIGVMRIACFRYRGNSGREYGLSAGLAIGSPLGLFLVFQFMLLIGENLSNTITAVVIASLVVATGLLMFIGLARALITAFRGFSDWTDRTERVFIAIIAFAMPMGGLLLNISIPFPVDFQATEVYLLATCNAALLLLASVLKERKPFVSLLLLTVTLPFSLYFFFVFLPYTPLSILAVIALGTGFLVLTPTVLFITHLLMLKRCYEWLKGRQPVITILVSGIAATCVLPAYFSVRGLADKASLNAALNYVYTPDINGSEEVRYPGSLPNLKRALSSHRDYKNGIYYPILSDYYSWLVFDNLVLPDDKIVRLEKTFFGVVGSDQDTDRLRSPWSLGRGGVRSRASMPRAIPLPRNVQVAEQHLSFVDEGQSRKYTLELTLENPAVGGAVNDEFVTRLQTIPGVFVTGFRLHMDGVAVPGRIFEKKTALWVYTMIRDATRRDPGLLVYNGPNEIELKVFPVVRGKPAKVELDFLVPGLSDHPLPDPLPDPPGLIPMLLPESTQLTDTSSGTFVSAIPAGKIPAIDRQAYLHVIVDRSAENGFTGDLERLFTRLQADFPEVNSVQLTEANYNILNVWDKPRHWEAIDTLPQQALPSSGGLDLDKVIANALCRYRDQVLDKFQDDLPLPAEPVFILASNANGKRTVDFKLSDHWQQNLSRLTVIEYGSEGAVFDHSSMGSRPGLIRIGHSIRPADHGQFLAFPGDPGEGSPSYYHPERGWLPLEFVEHQSGSLWNTAAAIWEDNFNRDASPGTSATSLENLVSRSRDSGILIPATSYIVVENEAQWRMLKLKEGQKLDQNEALSFMEAPSPGMWLLGIAFGLWLFVRNFLNREHQRKTIQDNLDS